MIKLDRTVCNDFKAASNREWLETNGIGGYAAGTISGAGARRYHALLTAATRPPLGRIRTVSKFEETLIIDGGKFELSSNQYPGTVYPKGFELIAEFRLDPFPIWRYEVNGIVLERKIFMVHGSNTTVCKWTILEGTGKVHLEIRPLLSFIDYHHLRHDELSFDTAFDETDGSIKVHPVADMPAIFFGHDAKSVDPTGNWYRNFEYAIERERGFDFTEDLFQPFVLRFDLSKPATVTMSTEKVAAKNVDKLERAEIKRRRKLISSDTA
jgi:predicted glycogen debranching enzyme